MGLLNRDLLTTKPNHTSLTRSLLSLIDTQLVHRLLNQYSKVMSTRTSKIHMPSTYAMSHTRSKASSRPSSPRPPMASGAVISSTLPSQLSTSTTSINMSRACGRGSRRGDRNSLFSSSPTKTNMINLRLNSHLFFFKYFYFTVSWVMSVAWYNEIEIYTYLMDQLWNSSINYYTNLF